MTTRESGLANIRVSAQTVGNVATRIEAMGKLATRYGLVLVLVWIGGMKFTAYEANGIQPMVASSPVLGWMYYICDTQEFSNVLGIVEIVIAIMIAARLFSANLAALGSAIAVLMFLTTLSFLFSTPGWEPSLGFPALSVAPGQFLLKDAVLLGTAVWSLGEALGGRCQVEQRRLNQKGADSPPIRPWTQGASHGSWRDRSIRDTSSCIPGRRKVDERSLLDRR